MSEERAQYSAGDSDNPPLDESVEIVHRISFGDGEISVKVTGRTARMIYYELLFYPLACIHADKSKLRHYLYQIINAVNELLGTEQKQ